MRRRLDRTRASARGGDAPGVRRRQAVREVTATRATEAMLASASPRKPSVATRSRSASVAILLVAWRASASGSSSGAIPPPSSVTRTRFAPPCSSATVTLCAPASRLFSRSSFTTEAGRSTTSPAAIWLTSVSGSSRIAVIGTRLALPRSGFDLGAARRSHGGLDHVLDRAAGDANELVRREAENRMGMSRRRPDLREPEQGAVDERADGRDVADGRDAADHEPGRSAHELGVGLSDRLADDGADADDVDPPRAARHHEQRRAARAAAEDERVRDLRHLAADLLRCGARRPGGGGQLDDARRDARGGERRADSVDGGVIREASFGHDGRRCGGHRRLYDPPIQCDPHGAHRLLLGPSGPPRPASRRVAAAARAVDLSPAVRDRVLRDRARGHAVPAGRLAAVRRRDAVGGGGDGRARCSRRRSSPRRSAATT